MRTGVKVGGQLTAAQTTICSIAVLQPCGNKELLLTIADWLIFLEGYSKYISALKKYVSTAYATKGRVTDSWHSDDYTLNAAWSFALASRIVHGDFSMSLTQSAQSSNCKYLIAPAFMYITADSPPAHANLFVKIVDVPLQQGIDNPVFDSVNGCILNMLSQKVDGTLGFFMTYVDSFLSYTYENAFMLEKVTNASDPQSPFFIPTEYLNIPEPVAYNRCTAVVSYAVNGKSLADLFKEACDEFSHKFSKYKNYRQIMLEFPQFYNAIFTLGTDYGMLHNDLHLGNILYDAHAGKMVCIDYGRMHFQAFVNVHDKFVSDFVHVEMQKFAIKLSCHDKNKESYANLMDEVHTRMKSLICMNGVYTMHVADLMTLAGNMYLFFLGSAIPSKVEKVKRLIDKFFNVTYGDKQRLRLHDVCITVKSVPHIISGFNEFATNIGIVNSSKPKEGANDWIPFFRIVGEGLLYMALMMSDHMKLEGAKEGKTNIFLNNVFCWKNFQFENNVMMLRFANDLPKYAATYPQLLPYCRLLHKIKNPGRTDAMDIDGGGSTSHTDIKYNRWLAPAATNKGATHAQLVTRLKGEEENVNAPLQPLPTSCKTRRSGSSRKNA